MAGSSAFRSARLIRFECGVMSIAMIVIDYAHSRWKGAPSAVRRRNTLVTTRASWYRWPEVAVQDVALLRTPPAHPHRRQRGAARAPPLAHRSRAGRAGRSATPTTSMSSPACCCSAWRSCSSRSAGGVMMSHVRRSAACAALRHSARLEPREQHRAGPHRRPDPRAGAGAALRHQPRAPRRDRLRDGVAARRHRASRCSG